MDPNTLPEPDNTPEVPSAETPRLAPYTGPFPPLEPVGQVGQPVQIAQTGQAQYPSQGYGPPPPVAPSMPPYPAQPARRKGWPVWAWVLLGMLSIIFIGCAVIAVASGKLFGTLAQTAEPILVTTQYSFSMQSHRFEEAQSYLACDLQSRYSPDDLTLAWSKLEDVGTVTGQNYTNPDVNATTAAITWQVTAGGKVYSTRLRLQKTGKSWKIVGGDPGLVPQP